jgi:hypothetical protein
MQGRLDWVFIGHSFHNPETYRGLHCKIRSIRWPRMQTKRFPVYVSEELVPEIQLALKIGRSLKNLIRVTGERFSLALQDERKSQSRK